MQGFALSALEQLLLLVLQELLKFRRVYSTQCLQAELEVEWEEGCLAVLPADALADVEENGG